MSWSMEDVLVGVITAPAKLANAARVIGEITRPPKLGHDVDAEVDADQAAHDKAVALGALQRFACRAPGPFDCLGCMYFTLKPCEYPRTSAATIETSAADGPVGDCAIPPSAADRAPDVREDDLAAFITSCIQQKTGANASVRGDFTARALLNDFQISKKRKTAPGRANDRTP